ncbi:PCP degradation transcriptional activation protein [compost metagenome]
MALTDYVEQLCMPHLLKCLAVQAPGVRIDVSHLSPSLPVEALDNGELDLVVGRFAEVPARFARQHWRSETLLLTTRRGHPRLTEGLDLEAFLQLRHLWVHGGQTRGMVDQWLANQGLARRIVYTTPNYLQAAHMVAGSDLAVVLPSQLARQFATLLPLHLWELPFNPGSFDLELVYLGHRQDNPAFSWLLEQILVVGGRPTRAPSDAA